jgi:hypothetical protein
MCWAQGGHQKNLQIDGKRNKVSGGRIKIEVWVQRKEKRLGITQTAGEETMENDVER